ncbi:predicted protein [Arabidopsis lyrata subsp. lyrata]|uniref:Predicted protein n=1 Tax=Arabidopsis lyrata subsp. lyrata TaxID=81972 RepID=D7KQ05_ARALL|nr:predicted protein [Arabidopsis lyrata subsp. lyrata]
MTIPHELDLATSHDRGNNDGSSDDSVIPSEHVRRMLEGSELESFMATSPSVTSVESIPTREMEGSDSSAETDPSEDLDENFGNVPIIDFVALSDDSDGDSSEESKEQMVTGFLFGDSEIDEPMWEGPDRVLYEFNSDDSCSMSLGTDFCVSDAPSEGNASRDSDCVMFMPPEYGIPRQALAYNMVSLDVEFSTLSSSPTLNFVEISSDSELSDADELGNGVPFSNCVKSEMSRMSILPRRFASRTWYDGYDRATSEMFHMSSEDEGVDEEVDEEVPDLTFECETLPNTLPPVEEPGVLFPLDESIREPVTLGCSSMATMIENMIFVGTLGTEPIRPPEGMPIWNERIRRSPDGTVVTEMEREDGRRSEPYSVTPFCSLAAKMVITRELVLMLVTIILMLARSVQRTLVRQAQARVRPRRRRKTLVLTRTTLNLQIVGFQREEKYGDEMRKSIVMCECTWKYKREILCCDISSRHTRLRGGRPWRFSSSAGPSNNLYGNNDGSSDDSVIPSDYVRRMLEGSQSESSMAMSPSVTSIESIPTREMEGSDSSVETDLREDLDEFEDDDVETSAESDEVVPLVSLGGSFKNVLITDFVVLSDDSDGDSSEESKEQMATGFLFGDSEIDEPMWDGADGVLYEFNSDD